MNVANAFSFRNSYMAQSNKKNGNYAQSSREERLAIADDVINNDHSLEHLRDQVADLDRQYRELTAR